MDVQKSNIQYIDLLNTIFTYKTLKSLKSYSAAKDKKGLMCLSSRCMANLPRPALNIR